MTAAPLICARCEQEIRPGDMVEFVGTDLDTLDVGEHGRILSSDDVLVVHATCPVGEDHG